MARYFFNLTNGKEVRDPDGEEFASLDAAKASAIAAARDFARNKPPLEINGVYVFVRDGNINAVDCQRQHWPIRIRPERVSIMSFDILTLLGLIPTKRAIAANFDPNYYCCAVSKCFGRTDHPIGETRL